MSGGRERDETPAMSVSSPVPPRGPRRPSGFPRFPPKEVAAEIRQSRFRKVLPSVLLKRADSLNGSDAALRFPKTSVAKSAVCYVR